MHLIGGYFEQALTVTVGEIELIFIIITIVPYMCIHVDPPVELEGGAGGLRGRKPSHVALAQWSDLVDLSLSFHRLSCCMHQSSSLQVTGASSYGDGM